MKRFSKIILTTMLVSSMIVMPVGATEVDTIKNQKAQAETEVSSLQSELTKLMVSIDELDKKLVDNGKKIAKTTTELTAAQATADKQYSDMKLRIKYMYEEDNASYLEKILSSESIADLINQASYMTTVHTYDRNMLNEYVKTKEKIATLKTSLEKEQKTLEKNSKDLETKQSTLETTISEKKDEIASFDSELQAAIEAANAAAQEAADHQAAENGNDQSNDSNDSNDSSNKTNSNKEDNSDDEPVQNLPSSKVGAAAAAYACKFVGNPYVYGGSSLTNGADCSGFVMAVYAHFGYSLPHSSSALRGVGKKVNGLSNAQPGDIICYSGHVAIYTGGGGIVHASNKKDGIKYGSANYKTIVAIRRVG